MNRKNLVCLAASFSTSLTMLCAPHLALAQGEHDHSPKHGGVVTPGKLMDAELVAKPQVITLYLRGHGKAPDISKASAKLTMLSGREKSEAMLMPVGDRFEAKGSFNVAAGTKVVAVVTGVGKAPMTARFTVK